MKFEFHRFWEKYWSIKFHENPSSEIWNFMKIHPPKYQISWKFLKWSIKFHENISSEISNFMKIPQVKYQISWKNPSSEISNFMKISPVKYEISWKFFHCNIKFHENPSSEISNFMKIPPSGAELFLADGRTDMTRLIVAFRNFARALTTETAFIYTSVL